MSFMSSFDASAGGNGVTSDPLYKIDVHEDILIWSGYGAGLQPPNTALRDMQDAAPFLSATAYDPSLDLDVNAIILSNLGNILMAEEAAYDFDTRFPVVDAIFDALSNYTFTNFFSALCEPAAVTIALLTTTLNTPATLTPNVLTTALTTIDDDLFDEVNIADATCRFSLVAHNDITDFVLPKFKRGMQNVSADLSSAFVVGEAMIWSRLEGQVNKFQADLRFKNEDKKLQLETLKNEFDKTQVSHDQVKVGYEQVKVGYEQIKVNHDQVKINYDQIKVNSDQVKVNYAQVKVNYEKAKISLDTLKLQYEDIKSKFVMNHDTLRKQTEQMIMSGISVDQAIKAQFLQSYFAVSGLTESATKMNIIARKEQFEQNIGYNEKHARWSMDAYQAYANMIGATSGTAISTGQRNQPEQSALAGAIGGAASGAAAGFSVGGPWGAAIGGAAGFVGGLLG